MHSLIHNDGIKFYIIEYNNKRQGGAKVITLMENAITFANGTKCQFGFDICEVNKQKF